MKQATISVTVNAPIEKVWEKFTQPKHITQWNYASDERHCPNAKNDLNVDGYFSYTMAAKDGSISFEFSGKYTHIENMRTIKYSLGEIKEDFIDGGREVIITFEEGENGILLTETFDAEDENTLEQQKQGRQAILGNFKKYVEASA